MPDDDKPPVSLELKLAAIAVATPLVQQVAEAATALFSAEVPDKASDA